MAIANSDGSIILTTKLDVTPISKALNALKPKFASLKEQRSAIQALTTAIKDQQFVIKDLEKEYAMLVAQGKGNSANAKELKARIAELKAELQQLTGAASAMGVETAAASTKAAQGLKQFGKRIAGIVKSTLIFSVLYKVMQSVVKMFQNILMSDDEFRQDWEELKAAFYTAAYPIINLIVPAIKWIVQQVRDWAVSIGKVAAALQGMSYSELVDQAKASKEAADNYEKMAKDSEKTADNVKKQLASFDDIQILSSGNDSEYGAGLAGFEGLKEYDISGKKSALDDLMTAIGGALAAVGLILLFNGQIGWGVGFLVAGAAFWAISEFAEGEFSTDPIVNTLVKIMGIAGTALLALGIILCVFGVINPVSIGLIVAGAALLVGALALSNEAIVEAIRGPLGVIMAIVGAALLVLGIILVCTGVGIPLGIALIAAGAVSLVTVAALNWDAIVKTVKNTANAVIDWLKTYGMLVLGIILCLSGAGIPLGIALIIKWAKDGAENGVPLAETIVEKVKEMWGKIKSFWNEHIKPVFTLKFWLDLAKNCGNGLIVGFENAINGIIGMFEKMINWIANGLNKISFDVPNWVPGIGGKSFGFNIPEVKFGRVSIPRLAKGAVIPPNREFLAVLGDQKQGTNIEAPLQTIVDAFNIAISQNGGYNVGGNTEVILEIDGREFGRAVVEQGNRENRRIGTRLVIA